MPADEQLLLRIRKNWARAEEEEHEFRREAVIDLEFSAGINQWPEEIQRQRAQDQRPCLTINRLLPSIHQVVNGIRRNKSTATVSPVEEGDVETAEVATGIIRHIDRLSNSPAVRSFAADHAVRCGKGFYRITTDWADPLSMDQEIFVERIKNQLSVYFDPGAQKPDLSDANHCFINTYLRKDDYARQYPNTALGQAIGMGVGGTGDIAPRWISADGVVVGEYFEKQYTKKTLVQLIDGSVLLEDDLPADSRQLIQRERQTELVKLMWYKTNGQEIIERTEWPGTLIPVIPMIGEEVVIEGRAHVYGIVRNARDPQRAYNYWTSAQSEVIALAPKAPFIVAEGQIEGHEKMWATANTHNHAFLIYKETSVGNVAVPPPQRNTAEPPVQAIAQARFQAADDLKATTGIFDASLGQKTNETSGIAIQRRQEQGDSGNYHFIDAHEIALQYEAEVKLDLIPKIYNRPGRIVRIIGENEEERSVTMNQQAEDRGEQKIFAPGAGKYDVAVKIGPSMKTQRQETVAQVIDFLKVFPDAAPALGPWLAKHMDWPGAQEAADILKRLQPAELQEEKGEKVPPQVQAKLKALDEQNQQLTEAVNHLQDLIDTKAVENESKERIANEKAELAIILKSLELDSDEAKTRLTTFIKSLDERQKLLHTDKPVHGTSGPTNKR